VSAHHGAAAQTRHLDLPRWRRPTAGTFILVLLAVVFVLDGLRAGVAVRPGVLIDGVGRLRSFLAEAFPPNLARADRIAASLLVTFEMALIGTIAGVIASLPLAVLAASNTTPHRGLYWFSRGLISVFRTIPDLVWGLIFVVTVGLGPPAGVLAIAADVVGFCGRFFAERIEEVEPGLLEGLTATGAGRAAVVAGAVIPSCLPSFVATSLFALESATRSSVILGVVGAGGIGIELTAAMALLEYDTAATIILGIFVVVLVVERISSTIRRRML
jgi:phosphonate transport system permease protein